MTIQILPARLANQIAAGEVVERPASVIKELVENSIDAEATDITIEVEKGGHKRILIRDNGKGIIKDQLGLALSRHATSKIKDIDDLEAISSLGFRGEALASISSVSRLVLSSCPESQDEAWQAHSEGRDMAVQLNPTAHPKGSSVEVIDLFFNTPARRKFLRAEKTEFQYIEEVFKRIALSNPSIGFTLKHNGKLIHKLPSLEQSLMHRRVAQICGQAFVDNSVPVNGQFKDITITGWCCSIGQGRKTNDLQYSFVNGRMMKDRVILHAIRQAFEGMIDSQTYPSFVIFIQMPCDQLDINVHPAKHEVRFHQSRLVHDLIFKSINDALLKSADEQGGAVNEADHVSTFDNTQNHGYASASSGFNEPEKPYKSSLSSASLQGRSGGYSSGSRTGYGQHPSAVQSAAYNELLSANLGDRSEVKSLQGGSGNGIESGSDNGLANDTLQWLVSKNNTIVIAMQDNLLAISSAFLMAAYYQKALAESDVLQPLLMPVSVNDSDAKLASILCECQFDTSAHGKKLILKKVPASMRQLPWLSIFPAMVDVLQKHSLNVSENPITQDNIVLLVSQLFCQANVIRPVDVQAWMNVLGQSHVRELVDQHAQALNLPHLNDTPLI